MRVTRAEEYGLRLVMRLAERGEQLTVRELSERESLPETTVSKVVSRLRSAGIVDAERGRCGGYSLSLPASEITLATVVGAFGTRVYDGDFCQRMSPGADTCTHSSSCGLRPVWRGLRTVIGDFLSEITVADVLGGHITKATTLHRIGPLRPADELNN